MADGCGWVQVVRNTSLQEGIILPDLNEVVMHPIIKRPSLNAIVSEFFPPVSYVFSLCCCLESGWQIYTKGSGWFRLSGPFSVCIQTRQWLKKALAAFVDDLWKVWVDITILVLMYFSAASEPSTMVFFWTSFSNWEQEALYYGSFLPISVASVGGRGEIVGGRGEMES